MSDGPAEKAMELVRRARAEQFRRDAAARGESPFRRPAPSQPRSQPNSDAERGRKELHAGESRPWEDENRDPSVETSAFERIRRAYLMRQYPIESLHSSEQSLVDRIWKELVHAINQLGDAELSTLDTSAIGGIVPVHSTGSGRVVSLRRYPDGSHQLLISHQFIGIALVLSTLARFDPSRLALQLSIGPFRASKTTEASRELYGTMARCAIVRDLLIQKNFHGIVASYRPRLTISSSMLFRSAVTFAMAHEAAHVLIGDRDFHDTPPKSHLRSDGTVAESQWGSELAQDRLALRLCRYVVSKMGTRSLRQAGRNSAAAGDKVLEAAVVSMVALHVIESGCYLRESTSHGSSIDRLGSLMMEFNPLTSPQALLSIKRLLPVVDTCLFMEPLPTEAWDVLASLIRTKVLRSNEKRGVAVRLVQEARSSDVVLTAKAEYEHTFDYLTSVEGTDIPNKRCLDLLRGHGRDALPEVLKLLGVADEGILERSTQLTRRDVGRAIDRSEFIRMPSGIDRRSYVDTWANVVSAAIREDAHRDRMFYHLLELGEDLMAESE